MPQQVTPQEFAASIRKRRPDLASVPDERLVAETLKFAPELGSFVQTQTLETSRIAASKGEFEQNLPRRTVGTALREGALGVPDALGLTAPSPTETLKNMMMALPRAGAAVGGVVTDALTGKGTGRGQDMLAGAAKAIVQGPGEMKQGLAEHDPDAFMHGLTGTAVVTAPAVSGAISLAKDATTGFKAALVPKWTPEDRVNSFATLTATGIKGKGVAPQTVAKDAISRAKQAYQEFGLNPETIPLKSAAGGVDDLGDMVRGGTEADLAKVNSLLEQEHLAAIRSGDLPLTAKFVPSTSVTIAMADRMVEIADRPIRQAMKLFDKENAMQAQAAVSDALLSKATEVGKINPALSVAYRRAAMAVQSMPGTVGALERLKIQANKATGALFKGSPSQQIALDVNPIIAQGDMASLIRQHLYPLVEEMGTINGQPMKGALIQAGKREANAIMARDGIYDSWSTAAKEHAPASVESWLHHTIRGHSESVPVIGSSFKRPAAINMFARALTGPESPMRDFNTYLKNGLGSLEGFAPETAVIGANPRVFRMPASGSADIRGATEDPLAGVVRNTDAGEGYNAQPGGKAVVGAKLAPSIPPDSINFGGGVTGPAGGKAVVRGRPAPSIPPAYVDLGGGIKVAPGGKTVVTGVPGLTQAVMQLQKSQQWNMATAASKVDALRALDAGSTVQQALSKLSVQP